MLTQNDLFQSSGSRFSEGVDLFVFTPRVHGTTIIRPQRFNFTANMVDTFMGNQSDMEVSSMYQDPNSEIQHAIVPEAQGIQLDTYNFDQFWSFIMVIDAAAGNIQEVEYATPRNRTVLTGYFLDEPFAPHTLQWETPIANPQAKVMFTQESRVTLQSIMGMTSKTVLRCSSNTDLTPAATAVMAPNGMDLMFTDTGTIAKNTSWDEDGDQRFISNHDAIVSQLSTAKCNRKVNYSPKQQILGLSKAIHSGIVDTEAYVDNQQVYMPTAIPQDAPYKFQDMATRQVGLLNGATPAIGTGVLNPTMPTTFNELNGMWPNMRVHPLQVPSVPEYDVYDQGYINPRSTMSSLASSVINGLAVEYKLSSIVFRYATWTPNQVMGNIGGSWMIEGATPIIDGDPNDFKQCIEQFKLSLETSLWPTLKSVGGEFDIMVNFDMSNNTLVNLNYLDLAEKHGSYYEHHNRLGGIVAPTIGNQNIFDNNTNQFSSLMNHIGAKITGPNTFGDGNMLFEHANGNPTTEPEYI